jgi:hypothetical protein
VCSVSRLDAQVAQLVEQRTENPRVGGSTPSLGTTPAGGFSTETPLFFAMDGLAADAPRDRGVLGEQHDRALHPR